LVRIRVPGSEEEAEQMYSRFLQLKAMCHHSVKLSVVLEFEANLPS
jgi:hypothetical protein